MTTIDEAFETVRRPHFNLDEDCWYSCAQAREEDGTWSCCDSSRAGGPCDCGADKANVALTLIRERLDELERWAIEVLEQATPVMSAWEFDGWGNFDGEAWHQRGLDILGLVIDPATDKAVPKGALSEDPGVTSRAGSAT